MFKIGDYFEAKDVVKAGKEAWDNVRELAKAQGYKIDADYGDFETVQELVLSYPMHHYRVVLDSDGDFLVCRYSDVAYKLKTLRKMTEFAVKKKEFPHVKIRVDSNRELFKLALEELVKRGYNDAEVKKFNIEHHRRVVGLIGRTDGVILVSVSEESFSQANQGADELIYDVKRVWALSNIRVKPRLMDIGGVLVNRQEYNEFIQRQLEVNGRAQ